MLSCHLLYFCAKWHADEDDGRLQMYARVQQQLQHDLGGHRKLLYYMHCISGVLSKIV
jgi:hypothetical protein